MAFLKARLPPTQSCSKQSDRCTCKLPRQLDISEKTLLSVIARCPDYIDALHLNQKAGLMPNSAAMSLTTSGSRDMLQLDRLAVPGHFPRHTALHGNDATRRHLRRSTGVVTLLVFCGDHFDMQFLGKRLFRQFG